MLHFGKVTPDGLVEQVKGVTYKVEHFLGTRLLEMVRERCGKPEMQRCKRSLYHVILYLAPGDYHHFHSPVDWDICIQRHFPGKLCGMAMPIVQSCVKKKIQCPGELLTVAPWAAKKMPGLFSLNERVVLAGEWEYGFFSFTAVGAYNVGSINMTVDQVRLKIPFPPSLTPGLQNSLVFPPYN